MHALLKNDIRNHTLQQSISVSIWACKAVSTISSHKTSAPLLSKFAAASVIFSNVSWDRLQHTSDSLMTLHTF